MKKKLIVSKIKCNHCEDIIQSKHRHDWVQCKCGKVYLDGGLAYQRIGFMLWDDFTDMSEWEEIKDEGNL